MIFKQHEDSFKKTFDYLMQSVLLRGKEKAVALQSTDSLNTIISDSDLIPRLEPQVHDLMRFFNAAI